MIKQMWCVINPEPKVNSSINGQIFRDCICSTWVIPVLSWWFAKSVEGPRLAV